MYCESSSKVFRSYNGEACRFPCPLWSPLVLHVVPFSSLSFPLYTSLFCSSQFCFYKTWIKRSRSWDEQQETFLWNSANWFLNQDPRSNDIMCLVVGVARCVPQGPLNWNHADDAHWQTHWLVVMWRDTWQLVSASLAVSARCCWMACPQGRIHVILKEVWLYLICYQFCNCQMKIQLNYSHYCTTACLTEA